MKRAKIIKGYKPKSNDVDVPEDELTLAELIQNAASRGLHSVRYLFFGNKDEDSLYSKYSEDVAVKRPGSAKNPPKGTTCVCVLGAQMLYPPVSNPITTTEVMKWNDASDGHKVETYLGDDRSAQIGAAYEQALRPE